MRVLESFKGTPRKFRPTFAYEDVLLLTEQLDEIRRAIPDQQEWLNATVEPICQNVVEVWHQATEKPLVLAPFAFPRPARPDPIIIHDWAFATFRLADACDIGARIDEVLANASANHDLGAAIALARASRSLAKPTAKKMQRQFEGMTATLST